MTLEIRGKKESGATIVYNKPVLLELQRISGDGVDPYLAFEAELIGIRSEIFTRYCRAGKLTKAQTFLKRGLCDVNRKGESGKGWTPLMHACYNGHLPVVEWLVETHNIDLNEACPNDGHTPMHCAAAGGHEHIIAYLIDHMGEFFVPTHTMETPLSLALQNGKVDALTKMLAPGTNLCEALVASHGVRNHHYVGMYNLLPPFNAEEAAEKARIRAASPKVRSRSRTPSPSQLLLGPGSKPAPTTTTASNRSPSPGSRGSARGSPSPASGRPTSRGQQQQPSQSPAGKKR